MNPLASFLRLEFLMVQLRELPTESGAFSVCPGSIDTGAPRGLDNVITDCDEGNLPHRLVRRDGGITEAVIAETAVRKSIPLTS